MLFILFGSITMAAALRMAVPLILSSIGGCFGDRTGIFNIALESFMLCAAFFATLGTYYAAVPMWGFCAALQQVFFVPFYSGFSSFIWDRAAWWSA